MLGKLQPSHLRPAVVATVLTAAVALGALGCSSNKNHEEREAAAGEPDRCDCIDTCMPDPGSGPVDCDRALDGLEFLTIWDFEARMGDSGGDPYPHGRNMYTYTDNSTPFLKPSGWQSNTSAGFDSYEFEPEANAGGPCHSEYALHLYGGPFRGWGGGVGITMNWIQGRLCEGDNPDEVCPSEDSHPHDRVRARLLDVSQWEGISFWGRRGPDGQAGIRVMLGDITTDDDVSYIMSQSLVDDDTPEAIKEYYRQHPRLCERIRECGCKNYKPCTLWDPDPSTPGLDQDDENAGGGYYCWDPEVDPPPGEDLGCALTAEYERCGETACNIGHPPWPDEPDDQFNGKPCTEYAFPASYFGEYCYEPGDPDWPAPPNNDEQCGDHWMKPVNLHNDWEFIKVPFTDLHQQGWAMESHHLDLSRVTVFRFTWDRGWIDYWIDDVSFYRHVDQ